MELPFERAAMRNDEMPDGLSQAGNKAFLALRWLYRAYRHGDIVRDRAKKEKEKIIREYNYDRSFERNAIYTAEFFKAISRAVSAYRKERTTENADRLVDIIDGIERPWTGKENEI